MNADLHSLAGPYALDALADDERAVFERHLADCPSCRAEVGEFAATAARLGAAAATTPPPDLRARVLAAAAETRQDPPPLHLQRQRRRGMRGGFTASWGGRLLTAAAAVVLVVAAGVAVVQVRRADDAARNSDQITGVLAAPDSRTLHGRVTGGGRVTVVVSDREDSAVVVFDALPATPRDRTYQLWLINGSDTNSAGTVDVDRPGRQSRVLVGGLAGTDALGLTVEPAGGSRAPTTDPIAQVPLS